jgi:hypothetical protein
MKKIEEQKQAAFGVIKSYKSLTAEERHKFVEFLAEMMG